MMMSTTNSHMMSTALPKVLFTLSPVNPTFPTSQISTVTILDDENIKWAFMQIHACHKVQMDTQTWGTWHVPMSQLIFAYPWGTDEWWHMHCTNVSSVSSNTTKIVYRCHKCAQRKCRHGHHDLSHPDWFKLMRWGRDGDRVIRSYIWKFLQIHVCHELLTCTRIESNELSLCLNLSLPILGTLMRHDLHQCLISFLKQHKERISMSQMRAGIVHTKCEHGIVIEVMLNDPN